MTVKEIYICNNCKKVTDGYLGENGSIFCHGASPLRFSFGKGRDSEGYPIANNTNIKSGHYFCSLDCLNIFFKRSWDFGLGFRRF